MDGINDWSRTHVSRMEMSKAAVMHLTRRRVSDAGIPLILDQTTLTPVHSHRFLGFILDDQLRFKEHAAHALGNGMRRAQQIARLSKTTMGLPAKCVHQLYHTVVVPSMLYAVDVFCTPFVGRHFGGRLKGSVGFRRLLNRPHRAMALLITGAMRTTAGDVAEAHAGLLPLQLQINKLCHRAMLRMATFPPSHPLYPLIKRAGGRYVQRHQAPLHELTHAFRLNIGSVETIPVVPHDPGALPQLVSKIMPSRDEAVEFNRTLSTEVRLYSDGSAHGGHVGAAAVMLREGYPAKTLSVYLGEKSRRTVYEAEIAGMVLASKLLLSTRRIRSASYGVDNQAALVAIERQKPRSGHQLVEILEHHLKDVKEGTRTLSYPLIGLLGILML